jgi:hypothetical protein
VVLALQHNNPVSPSCQLAGRPRLTQVSGGKSGLQGRTVAANGRRGQPQGQCNRKQTSRAAARGRAKRWGKSPPRAWQQARHGKPHREQNHIGMTLECGQPRSGRSFRPVVRVGCLRATVMSAPDEWSSRRQLQTEPGLQASWQFSPHNDRRADHCLNCSPNRVHGP